jgi:hypothetical protein
MIRFERPGFLIIKVSVACLQALVLFVDEGLAAARGFHRVAAEPVRHIDAEETWLEGAAHIHVLAGKKAGAAVDNGEENIADSRLDAEAVVEGAF